MPIGIAGGKSLPLAAHTNDCHSPIQITTTYCPYKSLPLPYKSLPVAVEALEAMEGGGEPPDYLDENDKDGTLRFPTLCFATVDCVDGWG